MAIHPLTDEEMVMPGPRPSKKRLEAWLEPKDDEEETPLNEAIEAIKKTLQSKNPDQKTKLLECRKIPRLNDLNRAGFVELRRTAE